MSKLPKEWISYLDQSLKVEKARIPASPFFDDFFPQQGLYFGVIAYDSSGKVKYPKPSENGFSTGDGNVEYVMLLSEDDLENPF